MSTEKEEDNKFPQQYVQLPLCTTRLQYRQGRKLTAVKVYTITNESNHLLIFGVPSVNLRREIKDLLVRFGKLEQFHVTTDYPAEAFTETYHACFQRIQSARIAKKMLDTTNFYGGSLHICYAPEFESIQEARAKLLQRKKDILFRLRNLQKETSTPGSEVNNKARCHLNVNNETECNLNVNNESECNLNVNNESEWNLNLNIEAECSSNVNYEHCMSESDNNEIVNEEPDYNINSNERKKLNMGEDNVIYVNKSKRKLYKKEKTGKKSKPSFGTKDNTKSNEESIIENGPDIVDCTSVDKQVVSNINEALNYNKFGNEIIKKIDFKPINKIVFNVNKKHT